MRSKCNNYKSLYTMHEQAAGFINGCSRTGEREALGALMRLMPLNCTIVRGLWLPAKKGSKLFTNLRKHVIYFAL